MNRYAIIKDGIVTNIIIWDGTSSGVLHKIL